MAPGERPTIHDIVRRAVRRNLGRGDSPQAVPVRAEPKSVVAAAASGPQPPVRSVAERPPAQGMKRPPAVVRTQGAAAGRGGLHDTVDQAVDAAGEAFGRFRVLPLKVREAVIANIRRRLLERVDGLARHAVEETGLGRVEHKVLKNRLVITKTPGPEILVPEATSGDDGLTLVEYSPFGVIVSITPVTNPSETIINNAISMLSGGNTVVCNAHPSAKRVTAEAIGSINEAAREAGSTVDPVHACEQPTIETAQQLMNHRDVRLLAVTGGPGVVKAAMGSGKKVVAAGAGNPPVVVDATANLTQAARSIVAGASFDNNIICVAEKVVIAEASIRSDLVAAMQQLGCRVLGSEELARVEETIFSENRGPNRPAVVNRRWVGKNAIKILRASRVDAEGDPPLALAIVPPEHPLNWTEQMLPVLPIVDAPTVEEAIDLAQRFERNNRHTAMMHSKNIEMLSRMATIMDTAIFVKNGSCAAGLGAGGEGHTSFTIASPTGEGLTTARTFCRLRRCVLVGAFRIV